MIEKTKNKEKLSKIIIIILSLIIIILTWQLIVTKYSIDTIIVDNEQTIAQKKELQKELNLLIEEHDRIKEEYGELTSQLGEKDSLIDAYAKEIDQLIFSQADYRRIKRKLDYLRGITQGYVSQVDSLYRVNSVLKQENQEIKGLYEDEQSRVNELSQTNEVLTEQVSIGAVLKAYGISATAVKIKSNGKESITDKAKRTDRIKICFTLSENPLANAGAKDVYIRIARPDDNLILTQGGYSFIFQGERIQYSSKKTITYNNKTMEICLNWDKDIEQELKTGIYTISVFTDDYDIGEGIFSLK